ncbi:YihY/virulence factor BrkB family protein [Blastopirellula sp. JC732]|uniref:YihY/virulence factor BrkB family protein n=1 Tax=Blastopirellula sediminis TaxID=2894196 RepID=A0A9X1MPR1_9BACT|nr:YihY/virulence factor BrkB family protein [Blastopirellula sediminis]MCC9606592.1 YihY/virulence factor BrkB family protein [Blastopirellula sediminis]MCC9630110.1 YihY/virulence factor BrkB family protein [Blastopirellula sediminis]
MNDANPSRFRISTPAAIFALLGLLVASYVISFYVISFTGYDETPQELDGYYFADPLTDAGERRHLYFCRLYWPLIEIDARLITGRRPGSAVLKLLSCSDEGMVDAETFHSVEGY